MSIGLIGMFLLTDRIASIPFLKRIALVKQEDALGGYTIDVKSNQSVVGKEGIADTTLRPAGRIMIDDEPFDAQADNEYIEKGSKVRVIEARSSYLIVELIKD
jgi:membrane-bound serine protease (ClpP class)